MGDEKRSLLMEDPWPDLIHLIIIYLEMHRLQFAVVIGRGRGYREVSVVRPQQIIRRVDYHQAQFERRLYLGRVN